MAFIHKSFNPQPMTRYNSTITPKIGDCDCGRTDQPLTKGKCPVCYWSDIRAKSAAKKAGVELITPPDFRARKTPKKKIEGLSEWFDERRQEMTGICIETGAKTAKHNDQFFIFSIAHVLPKSIFPSVAIHPDNWLELSIDAHTKYDRSWDDASKMRCFAAAKEKFAKFESLIAPDERRRIPECFYK